MSGRTVLITGAGSDVAYAYALALAQHHPDVRLVTADEAGAEWVSASVHATAHRSNHAFRDDALTLARLAALVAAEDVTHWLPTGVAETAWAVRERLALARRLPALQVVGAAGDPSGWADLGACQHELARRVAALSIEVIAEASAAEISASERRVFGVDVLPDGTRAGAFVSTRERIQQRGGLCTKTRIAPVPALQQLAAALVGGLGIGSAFAFRASVDAAGRAQLHRLRPRLSADSTLSTANGCDFFGAQWARAFGLDPWPHLQPVREVAHVTRQYVELLAGTPT